MSVAQAATRRRVFTKTSAFHSTLEKITRFHDEGGPQALTPPPIFVQVHRDDRKSLTEGELEFTLWIGPVPVRWLARHEAGPTPTSFADLMIYGPLAYWRHEHIFREVPDGVELTDRVTLEHKPGWRGWLTRLVFDGLPLQILFFYRHLRTRLALRRL